MSRDRKTTTTTPGLTLLTTKRLHAALAVAMLDLSHALALVCGGWCCFVLGVQAIGVFQLLRNFSRPPAPAASDDPAAPDTQALPHVTIIRPVKGVETALYDCLASSFRQTYPRARLSVHLCVADRADPALPVLERVVADFPAVDARLYVEEDDPVLHGPAGHAYNLGPNPKIRNMSRAYREAPGGEAAVIWIVDCNVWVAPGVCGRMVEALLGSSGTAPPYKFVHQLPLVVDTASATSGAALDEMFMATSHAKFYAAINTVSVAPCIVGKSNMFRRAHLARATDPAANPTVLRHSDGARGRGLDFFSSYICEDHLIGELLWRTPAGVLGGDETLQNHRLLPGDPAIQPMQGVLVQAYASRRMRWLRVRKWTVLVATLVEPGIESLVWCGYMAFAVVTLRGGGGWSWMAFGKIWATGVTLWAAVDFCLCRFLLRCQSVAVDADTPAFARGRRQTTDDKEEEGKEEERLSPRPLAQFLLAWVGREVLALPIWMWAVLLGTTVTWRGKHFRVRMDMRVVALDGEEARKEALPKGGILNGKMSLDNGKARLD